MTLIKGTRFELLDSWVEVNVAGEGEVEGAVNVNTSWIIDPSFRDVRTGSRTLEDLKNDGLRFIIADKCSIAHQDWVNRQVVHE